jgi:hypothetical protein
MATPAAAAVIAEHAKTHSTSSVILEVGFIGFPDQVNYVSNVCDLSAN